MNHKSLLSSWFGLGLLMFVLQYPLQYIFALVGMAHMQSLAIAIAGMAAAMIITYCFYPHLMSPAFKIYAMITSFCMSMTIAIGYILTNSALRSSLNGMLQNIFYEAHIRTLLLTGSIIILGLLVQFGLWYLFITLGNKQMVKVLEKQAKR